MAGRGRSATLPAWMANESNSSESNGVANGINAGSHQSRQSEPEHRGGGRGGRSRSPDRRSRSRDRDRRRHEPSRRSRSPSPGVNWTLRRANRISNFDVRPPDGVVLPSVGAAAMMMSAPLIPNSQHLQMLQRYGVDQTDSSSTNMAADSLAMQQTKHARRLYVGGIPPGTTEDVLGAYFTDVIRRAVTFPGPPDPTPAVVNVYINHEKCFAFVELKSVELATTCLGLDGVKYTHSGGTVILRIRRASDFKPEQMPVSNRPAPILNLALLGVISTTVADGPSKIFVGGLPYTLTDDNVKELLCVFGPLKSFHMVRDPGMTTSKGYGFCEFQDMSAAHAAIEGLNGMKIGEKTLTVRLGMTGNQPIPTSLTGGGVGAGVNPLAFPISVGGLNIPMGNVDYNPLKSQASMVYVPATKVLKLSNMVTFEELADDQEYADIVDDVRSECSSYGQLVKVLIPRVKEGFSSTVQGNIYVEFADQATARAAAAALSGRKFADRTVNVEYFDEAKFASNILT